MINKNNQAIVPPTDDLIRLQINSINIPLAKAVEIVKIAKYQQQAHKLQANGHNPPHYPNPNNSPLKDVVHLNNNNSSNFISKEYYNQATTSPSLSGSSSAGNSSHLSNVSFYNSNNYNSNYNNNGNNNSTASYGNGNSNSTPLSSISSVHSLSSSPTAASNVFAPMIKKTSAQKTKQHKSNKRVTGGAGFKL